MSPGRPLPTLIQNLIVDTGSPAPLIVSPRVLARVSFEPVPPEESNFGTLKGGLAIVSIPILQFRQVVLVYASIRVATFVASEGFDGLAGKPFLDLFRWSNGNGGEFCLSYEPTPEE